MIKHTPIVAKVSLSFCVYTKDTKQLSMDSNIVLGRFPDVIEVRSNFTGVVVEFVPINENHPLFCQDGWDGEQAVYEPLGFLKNVESLVVYHGDH